MRPNRLPTGPGQESVWDYPRPARLEPTSKHIRVVFQGITLAETRRAMRVLETSHPPVYYISPEDILMEYLQPSARSTFCEWKGRAAYYDVVVRNHQAPNAAWYYPDPTPSFAALKDCVAFYAQWMDACYVNGERVQPQPGGFYGGWITCDIVGPFKGEPGTDFW